MSGTGYTRQSAGQIVSGLVITAAAHNNEFNQLQAAFDNTTGHAHDGGVGGGALIAKLNGLASTAGMINFDGVDTFTPRTITSTSGGLVVTNGEGTAGNPSFALNTDLQGLATLNTNGVPYRTSAGTYSAMSQVELLGIVALASTGVVQRTSTGTYTASASLGIQNVSFQIITSSNIYTPTAGTKFCIFFITAGGGAGGNGSFGGGGAGGTVIGLATAANIGTSKAVVLGAGGTATGTTSGGNSSFGTSGDTVYTLVNGGTVGNSIGSNGGSIPTFPAMALPTTGGSGTGINNGGGGCSFWGGGGGGNALAWGAGGGGGNGGNGKDGSGGIFLAIEFK